MAIPRNFSNRILRALSTSDRRRLAPHLEPTPLALRFEIEKPNKRIERVYFVEEGIISVVAVGIGNKAVEIGLIGREGMTGSTVVLGNHRSPNTTYVQVAGAGYRIGAPELRKAMAASATMRGLFLGYVQTFMTQTAHTAVSNGRATIEERLARWILMAHDRVGCDRLPLTHEFLALMLGVRRPGVTNALNLLAGEGSIRTARGEITVLDRQALERRASDLYGLPEAEYRRLIG